LSEERISLGKRGEDIAVDYLTHKGYQIVVRNYRRKTGEIDIIVNDGDCIVFVEVKTRKTSRFGHPAEAVTKRKQNQISLTALNYLTRQNLMDAPARFNVIAVTITRTAPEITHIIGAFETTR